MPSRMGATRMGAKMPYSTINADSSDDEDPRDREPVMQNLSDYARKAWNLEDPFITAWYGGERLLLIAHVVSI